MSDDPSKLWLADIAALDAEAEANERYVEPITRFTQALNDLEKAAAQYEESGTVADDAIAQAFTTIDGCYQSAAQFLERHDIDPTPLLVWVQTKPIEGIANLRVLIQRAAIANQCRGEQLRKSISLLRAKAEAHAESERAEGAGARSDPTKGEQAEGTEAAAQADSHEAAGAGRDLAEGEQAEGTAQRRRNRRGRQRKYDQQKDREIAEAWQRAHDSGVQKKDFVKDLDPKLSCAELNRLLNRVRRHKNGADK
jgi:hypothetical protein